MIFINGSHEFWPGIFSAATLVQQIPRPTNHRVSVIRAGLATFIAYLHFTSIIIWTESSFRFLDRHLSYYLAEPASPRVFTWEVAAIIAKPTSIARVIYGYTYPATLGAANRAYSRYLAITMSVKCPWT
jgi:hypothetical protein